MFGKVKSWDNRGNLARMLPNGRTWTRRIQWLEDGDGSIKLKMELASDQPGPLVQYREVLASQLTAETIWQRFKSGQPIDDCISILGAAVHESLQSKKAHDSKGANQ